jgi:hypothetical protein
MYGVAGSEFFEKFKCPETRCLITFKQNYMPLENFDALLFYITRDAKNLPPKRNSKQLYIAGLFFECFNKLGNCLFKTSYVQFT